MCRTWFRYQHYVQDLIQVPELRAGLDSGSSIMCRSWSRYQHYVQVLIQVSALCAGLDSGTSIMCRSWFRYQYYVQLWGTNTHKLNRVQACFVLETFYPEFSALRPAISTLLQRNNSDSERAQHSLQSAFLHFCKEKTIYILWKQYIHSRLEAWIKTHKSGVAIT